MARQLIITILCIVGLGGFTLVWMFFQPVNQRILDEYNETIDGDLGSDRADQSWGRYQGGFSWGMGLLAVFVAGAFILVLFGSAMKREDTSGGYYR